MAEGQGGTAELYGYPVGVPSKLQCLTVDSKEVGVVRFQRVRPVSLSLGEEEVLHGLEELGRQRYLETTRQYHTAPLSLYTYTYVRMVHVVTYLKWDYVYFEMFSHCNASHWRDGVQERD